MRRVLQILACSAALATLGLLLSATALASGTGTSAGDQQYVDPLTTTTATTPAATTHTTTSLSNTSTTPTGSSGSFSGNFFPPSSSSTSTTSSRDASSSGTLPYTGLNVEACIAVGFGLLGAGLLLRRIVARA